MMAWMDEVEASSVASASCASLVQKKSRWAEVACELPHMQIVDSVVAQTIGKLQMTMDAYYEQALTVLVVLFDVSVALVLEVVSVMVVMVGLVEPADNDIEVV